MGAKRSQVLLSQPISIRAHLFIIYYKVGNEIVLIMMNSAWSAFNIPGPPSIIEHNAVVARSTALSMALKVFASFNSSRERSRILQTSCKAFWNEIKNFLRKCFILQALRFNFWEYRDSEEIKDFLSTGKNQSHWVTDPCGANISAWSTSETQGVLINAALVQKQQNSSRVVKELVRFQANQRTHGDNEKAEGSNQMEPSQELSTQQMWI